MKVDKQSGLLSGVAYRCSPNQDARPDKDDISGIVIHNISLPPGEFGGGWINDLFLNQLDPTAHPYFAMIAEMEVSSHLLIRRDGEAIQYVPFHQRAWHAGASCWDERERCNDFTIGIELEGCDEQYFEQCQYDRLAELVRLLCEHYPELNTRQIKGHSQIAPGRKTDPGPYFDWEKLYSLLLE
jgi:AmpD protein